MADDHAARAARFEALCRLLYGPDDWRVGASKALGVSLRNVQYWTAPRPIAAKLIPPGVLADLAAELRRRVADPAELARIEAQVDAMQTRWLAGVEVLTEATRAMLDEAESERSLTYARPS